MTPAEQKERNYKLSKTIIDYFGQTFFKGKKILDLGSGNGELANVFARLGSEVTCVDARESNLSQIRKKFPYIKTMQINLEEEFPFEPFSFDLAISIDLLCHLKHYEKHLENLLSVSEKIVLETEVLDSSDQNLLVPIFESKEIETMSFVGEGSLVSDKNIQNKLSSLNAKFKRVDETKLNHGQYRYDWAPNNIGRKFGNRRLWVVRRDKHLVKKIEDGERLKNAGPVEYSSKFFTPARRKNPTIGDSITRNDPDSISLPYKTKSLSDLGGGGRAWSMVGKEKRFVIVIPSYNNERWCERNIMSALNQNYDKFRIIFVDDCSSDRTFKIVSGIVHNSHLKDKCTLIRNDVRKGALSNLYHMIHSCADDEIILTLDGDDWFPNDNVLTKLKEHYNSGDVWLTYGQYQNHPDKGTGIAQKYPANVVETSSFRRHPWCASHLRTFYAWLFKRIRKSDLCIDGEFFKMTWDFAIMFPMLEMAKERSKFISDILYIYNMENPINDHKVNVKLQQDLDRRIRNMARYPKCTDPPLGTCIGLLIIATGKYDRFIEGLIASADKYFMTNGYNVTYFIFSDSKAKVKSERQIINIPITHKPFPFASMDRFAHFSNNADKFYNQDYLYYVDVDCLFASNISDEIIGDLVGVQHCGFVDKKGPYEPNEKSNFYVPPTSSKKYKNYFGGGFSGGRKDKYLALSNWCKETIDKDLAKGIMPIWHDETAINRYFLDNEPTVILNPSYHYPEKNINYYKKMWHSANYEPKIILLDKDHSNIRK